MPNYDYSCEDCGSIFVEFVKYEDRDTPQTCACGGKGTRGYYSFPEVRTAKTSRTFLDGHRNDGYKEEIKAAELDAKAMNYRHGSDEYKALKAEAKTRRLLNNNKKVKDALKSKTRLADK